jgi:hypothetical protein
VVAQSVSSTQPLPPNGRIELAFDRYLLPSSITRQSLVLSDLNGNVQTPTIAYDPVARIVTITPTTALQVDQSYKVSITTPSSATDPTGLRSIDGATIDPTEAAIEFPVQMTATAQPALPTVDFCKDIFPIFAGKCGGASCHGAASNDPTQGASGAVEGLELDSPQDIEATAIGLVAHEANTGPQSQPMPPGLLFGVDMPIIDPGSGAGGDPGNSWLLYKLLLAYPAAQSSTTPATACAGGPAMPTDVSMLHLITPPAVSDPADDPGRAVLTDYVLGREMPFPSDPSVPLEGAAATLSTNELELVSRWIAQPPAEAGSMMVPAVVCGCIQQ